MTLEEKFEALMMSIKLLLLQIKTCNEGQMNQKAKMSIYAGSLRNA